MENDAEIFPAHYAWKVAEIWFKMASMMNKLAMIKSCELFLKNKIIFFAKNHCEIQVCTILVCALYSIKYSSFGLKSSWPELAGTRWSTVLILPLQ
jgi:hypothetical protein